MATKKNTKSESPQSSWEEAAWKVAGPVDPARVPFAVLTAEAADVGEILPAELLDAAAVDAAPVDASTLDAR
jgi:hypothetical protein